MDPVILTCVRIYCIRLIIIIKPQCMYSNASLIIIIANNFCLISELSVNDGDGDG
jgi:hypothetical protein